MLVVGIAETGDIIEVVGSIAEGEKLIDRFEADDKSNDCYTEGFYELAEAKEGKTSTIIMRVEPTIKEIATNYAKEDNITLSGYIVNLIIADIDRRVEEHYKKE